MCVCVWGGGGGGGGEEEGGGGGEEVGELLRTMNSTEHKAMNGPGWSRMDGWRVNKWLLSATNSDEQCTHGHSLSILWVDLMI